MENDNNNFPLSIFYYQFRDKGAITVEAKLIGLGVETFKLALYLALPMLMAGLVAGLAISIFQATTQINEMTLSFVPKIIVVVGVIIFTMPWMMNMMIDYTTRIINLIPEFLY